MGGHAERRRGPQCPLALKQPDSAVCCRSLPTIERTLMFRAPRSDLSVLSAGRGRPVRTSFAALVTALPVAGWTMCGASCLTLVGPRACWLVNGTRNLPVEALFPQGRERLELGSPGWSRVLGIDALGGAPHCDFADEGGARVAPLWCACWLGVTLPGVVLDLVGEVGDQVGSLCQVLAPDGMGTQHRWWNAGEPGQRTWVVRRELWEAPVKGRRPGRRRLRGRVRGRLSACGAVGAFQFQPRGRAGVPRAPWGRRWIRTTCRTGSPGSAGGLASATGTCMSCATQGRR